MSAPSLTEQQWDKIDRLVKSSSYHVIDYIPHQTGAKNIAASFFDLEDYLEREYLPRVVDRYVFICLIAVYTWADFVGIVPGKPPRGGKHPVVFPSVITETESGGSTPQEVDRLTRSTLLGEAGDLTYIFFERRELLVELRDEFTVAFFGLIGDDAELIRTLTSVNGLFLKYMDRDGSATTL